MSSKLKQSIAIQRQLPEHIRENYPAFVDFIKLYYDFLEETQSQNLEDIRDIDTTLEQFIDRFKSELAKNIPIEFSGDKRFLLKHLREFYLSRGSEASFKFLFRTLFEKDATLFYPSTQILRASDGKWKQDVSIFVKVSGSTQNLFPLNGNFITITTSKKTITTYVENVLEYSNTTYEIFIQKDYANEIEVGSAISFKTANSSYTGVIVKCPSKVSVYKSGKGFKVGSIYALQTSLGRGCVVKITKIDSNGGIKAVQVIRFGLDYESTFYSYLSSKTITASEYVHPINLATGIMDPFTPATAPTYTPGDPAYNERSGGFIDYGFMNKQTYFYYDDTIPVGSPDKASDRFFADPSYVGEISQQFYTDQTEAVIDEDIAIIKVELGAVAKYPGYYLKADGFISDEMHIHDGKYYQAFSYVIKVEEELRKYADIVKALVHPAGMKMYAEYSIFREIKVPAVTPLLSRTLQLPLLDRPPSLTITDDRGFGLDSLGNQVYSSQGKAALFTEKNISDLLNSLTDSSTKFLEKYLSDNSNTLSLQYKQISKAVQDFLDQSLDSTLRAYVKNISETVSQLDPQQKLIETLKQDSQGLSDYISNVFSKSIEDSLNSYIESQIKFLEKNINDDVPQPDSQEKLIETLKQDSQALSDLLSNLVGKFIQDLVDYTLDSYLFSVDKRHDEYLLQPDYTAFAFSRSIIDSNLQTDSVSLESIKSIVDYMNSLTDDCPKEFIKQIQDYTLGFEDYVEVIRTKLIEDISSIVDTGIIELQRGFAETFSLQDSSSNLLERANADTINISTNGRIVLAPYDAETYFAPFEGYQQAITIS